LLQKEKEVETGREGRESERREGGKEEKHI
jgi:hypothetical protein